MFRASFFALAFSGMTVQSYEPPRLRGGSVEPVQIMTVAAGAVMLDLTVSERGDITNTRVVNDVAPFTDLTRNSISSWQFEPATDNRVRTDSRVVVIGLYRPPVMLFPRPQFPDPPPPDDDDAIPFPTEVAVPPYPPNRIGSATVLVEVDVDERGTVTAATVLSPETGFDEPATSTAQQWRFRPAQESGRAVRSRVYMIMSFREPQG